MSMVLILKQLAGSTFCPDISVGIHGQKSLIYKAHIVTTMIRISLSVSYGIQNEFKWYILYQKYNLQWIAAK